MQWYFIGIHSENMYIENVKNKEIVNLEFEVFMVYLYLINLFLYRDMELKRDFTPCDILNFILLKIIYIWSMKNIEVSVWGPRKKSLVSVGLR